MTNDKYKMVQDLADGWREKYEDAKQQLVKAQRAIDEHTYWKAKALDLEVKRDIAVSTLEKVKVDRATAQKALAAQCEETKKLTETYEAGKREQAAELEAARAEIERLENQVQARDAELWGRTQKILQLEQQLAAEQAKNVGLRDFIARAQVSSGVCCCGEPIDGHSSPMSCGHSPVDMWDPAVGKLLDAPSDTSSLEAIVKKAGEMMRERCASESCRSHEYDATKAIRTIPAVTLEDLK